MILTLIICTVVIFLGLDAIFKALLDIKTLLEKISNNLKD